VGHRQGGIIKDSHDDLVESGALLLALASSLAKFKGTSDTGVFLLAVVNGLLLGALTCLEVGSIEQGVDVLHRADAHSLGHLDVALPVDSSGGRGTLDLEDKVLDVLRELDVELVSRGDSGVLVREVESKAVVTGRHCCCWNEEMTRAALFMLARVTAGSGFVLRPRPPSLNSKFPRAGI